MIRPSLQSAPEPPALDLPPVSKHVSKIWGNLLRFLTLTFDLFNRKLAVHLLVPRGMFIPSLIFYIFFVFELRTRTGHTNRQTDG